MLQERLPLGAAAADRSPTSPTTSTTSARSPASTHVGLGGDYDGSADVPGRAGGRLRLPAALRRAAVARLVRGRPGALGSGNVLRALRDMESAAVVTGMTPSPACCSPPAPAAGWAAPRRCCATPHGVPFLDRAVGLLLDGGCATVTVVLGAVGRRGPRRCSTRPAGPTTPRSTWWSPRTGTRAWAPRCAPGCGRWRDAPRRRRRAGHAGGPARRRRAGAPPGRSTPAPARRGAGPGDVRRAAGAPGADRPRPLGGRGGDRRAGTAAPATTSATHEPVACECGDLATGRDLDRPEDLEPAADYRGWCGDAGCAVVNAGRHAHRPALGLARRPRQAARRHRLPLRRLAGHDRLPRAGDAPAAAARGGAGHRQDGARRGVRRGARRCR